jgi:Putative auto-transporter adhesin, head GIN domain
MNPLARIVAVFTLSTSVAALAVAADGRETRAASGFTAIALTASANVDILQGDTEGLVVEGSEKALADLETVVEEGVLKIRQRSRFTLADMSAVRVHVSARSIEALRVMGSGDITAPALRAPNFKISVSGSGDVRIGDLAAKSVEVAVTGSGDVLVGGKTDTFSTSVAGSGDVKAAKLEAREAKVSIAGSGDVTLWARESLAVSVLGSGDVRFYGNPAVNKTVVGSGSVSRVADTPS